MVDASFPSFLAFDVHVDLIEISKSNPSDEEVNKLLSFFVLTSGLLVMGIGPSKVRAISGANLGRPIF